MKYSWSLLSNSSVSSLYALSKKRNAFFKVILNLVAIIGFSCIAGNQSVIAQWTANPALNTPICTAADQQMVPLVLPDGMGGVIITWDDTRDGLSDIYAQRINAAGVAQWAPNGVVICNHPVDQGPSGIISDGAGGAIIVWSDHRNGLEGDIYAQRINGAGVVQWTANGVPVCTAPVNQTLTAITTDGAGGAIISWWDRRFGGAYDIFAQRINAAGLPQWTTNGIAICTSPYEQNNSGIISDGAGGAIMTWYDKRNGNDYDIYAQRVNASGVRQWAANGINICNAANDQSSPFIVPDGAGGGIITWIDNRTDGVTWDIYAQRINAAGVMQWAANGLSFCTAPGHQVVRNVDSDGAGGVTIVWDDWRSGVNNADIYTQRINGAGAVQWTANGQVICAAGKDQQLADVMSDNSGGAIITWLDDRYYVDGPGVTDLYAQMISGTGVVQWRTNGVVISNAARSQSVPEIVTDGAGGAIIVWYDDRDVSSSLTDIYAQNVHADGTIGSGKIEITICSGSGTLLTSFYTGATYQWQVNTGSGFTNITDNANYAGVTTASLQLSNILSAEYGYSYRCMTDGIDGEVYELKFSNTWTGSLNSNWNNPGNWSCGIIPDENTDVVISSGTIVVTVNTTVRSLSVAPGVNFSVAPGVHLTVTH